MGATRHADHRGPGPDGGGVISAPAATPPRTNRLWAELMQRSLAGGVEACPRCGDRLELIALIEDPTVIGASSAISVYPPTSRPHGPRGRRRSQSGDRIRGTARTCRCPDASHRYRAERRRAPTTARSRHHATGGMSSQHGRLTGVFKRRIIRAVRAGPCVRAIRAVLAGGRGRISGIPSTTGAKIPLMVLVVR